ncbi:MAG: hypothetical protein AAB535_02525 [Patescibacteria group bacterium]
MTISFTTSSSNVSKERMYAPLGAQTMRELPDFDAIKEEDLQVGTSVGASPIVPRTWVDPDKHIYLHGEEGVLAALKNKR